MCFERELVGVATVGKFAVYFGHDFGGVCREEVDGGVEEPFYTSAPCIGSGLSTVSMPYSKHREGRTHEIVQAGSTMHEDRIIVGPLVAIYSRAIQIVI